MMPIEGSQRAMATDWDWPDELDAMVAAPAFHELLLENEHVRVLHTRILPGQTVPVHTHRWRHVQYVMSWGAFIRRDQHGNVLYDTRSEPPPAIPHVVWSQPLPPHTVENVGQTEISVIGVEVKTPPQ
jgi:hypothetical protein